MPDQITETVTTGWGKRIVNSFVGVLVGLALFVISFVVLWKTEGRTDFSKVAKKAIVASSSAIDQTAQDKLVSVTAPLETKDSLGDSDYIKPGNYLVLERRAEMFAWVEKVSTKTQKNTGGSETTTKTYSYEKEWTTDPENSSEFKQPEGHANPEMPVSSQTFKTAEANVGPYKLDMERIRLPGSEQLSLGKDVLVIGLDKKYTTNGDFLFSGQGSLASPQVGDVRISFQALPSGKRATVFGKLSGEMLDPFFYKGEKSFYRAFFGSRDEAIARLKAEYKAAGWIGRIIGFLLMWIGLMMLGGPLNTILDFLPFLGSAGRFVTGLVAFPIALALSAITIIISMIAHNIIALIIVLLLIAAVVFFLKTRKKTAV